MARPKKASYTRDKPPCSYVALCVMAILNSPRKKLTLSQIYQFVTENFVFYRNTKLQWKNSLRHSLSHNDCFVKDYSSMSSRCCFWKLHENCLDMFKDGSLLRRKQKFQIKEKYYIRSDVEYIKTYTQMRVYTDFSIDRILAKTAQKMFSTKDFFS